MSKPNNIKRTIFLFFGILFLSTYGYSQGTWTPIASLAPDTNNGVTLLLSDGTVIVKTRSGGGDGYGNIWNKLTPDIHGSYVNGTWSTIAPMHDTRLYFSSQLLKDGRMYVAGGEYGTGGATAEIYDPQANTWTVLPSPVLTVGDVLGDASSEILPNGKILQAVVVSQVNPSKETTIYDPMANTFAVGPVCHGSNDEAAWVKLPDNSILFVDLFSTNAERYIPALNQWVVDASAPINIYGSYDYETGAGLLLPDGRVFYMGGNGKTLFYTPSGNNANGTWAIGPTIPNGLAAPDAAAAMMANGKILCAFSPISTSAVNVFLSPTYFYEFDYTNNSFTKILAPNGDTVLNEACYATMMLDLPDGTILYGDTTSNQYYVYKPGGTPVAAGKPIINNVIQSNCDFSVVGTLFNGISEGAAYGDDWQMTTNFPVVRLSSGTNVYYARSFNWNSRGVQRGSELDTTQFALPVGLPIGTYSLVVIANGISSNPYTFVYSLCSADINQYATNMQVNVYPNPAYEDIYITSAQHKLSEISITDMLGRELTNEKKEILNYETQMSIANLPNGVYFVNVKTSEGVSVHKIVIQH